MPFSRSCAIMLIFDDSRHFRQPDDANALYDILLFFAVLPFLIG